MKKAKLKGHRGELLIGRGDISIILPQPLALIKNDIEKGIKLTWTRGEKVLIVIGLMCWIILILRYFLL